MEALRQRGRRVVLVGDLNISPAHIDSCEPGAIPTQCYNILFPPKQGVQTIQSRITRTQLALWFWELSLLGIW